MLLFLRYVNLDISSEFHYSIPKIALSFSHRFTCLIKLILKLPMLYNFPNSTTVIAIALRLFLFHRYGGGLWCLSTTGADSEAWRTPTDP